jgi:hypothetical protein
MTAVPHTDLPPFFTGFPVVIKTTPTFEPGASISTLAGATLTARITNGATVINGSVVVAGADATMAFSAVALTPGAWNGMLAYQDGPMATFSFVVERSP